MFITTSAAIVQGFGSDHVRVSIPVPVLSNLAQTSCVERAHSQRSWHEAEGGRRGFFEVKPLTIVGAIIDVAHVVG